MMYNFITFSKHSFLSLSAALMLCGCATLTHYNWTKDTTPNKVPNGQKTSFIDAKQRVVVSTSVPIYKADGTTVDYYTTRTCAEPSPDALSAIAASQSGTFGDGKREANAKNALAESVSSIGLRTQSIQLMRDSMYRLCEAYMSGALDDMTYQTMQRRFQSSMVAILAIEQLTGVIRPPAVTITGDAASGNAELVAKYTEKTEDAKIKLRAAEKARDDYKADDYAKAEMTYKAKEVAVKAADGNADNDLTEAEQKTLKETTEAKAFETAKTKGKDLSDTADNAKGSHESYNKARLAALAGDVKAATSIYVEGLEKSVVTANSLAAVSNAVTEIVKQTLGLSFSQEFCTSLILKNPDSRAFLKDDKSMTSPITECLRFMQASTKKLEGETNAFLALSQDKTLTPEQSEALKNLSLYSYQRYDRSFADQTRMGWPYERP